MALALLLGTLPNPGAAYDRIRITPSITVEELYDSNIFNTESDTDSDLTTIVSPSIDFRLQNDTTRLSMGYRLRSSHHLDFSDLNSIDHRFVVQGTRTLTPRLSLFGAGSFTRLPKSDDVEVDDVIIRSGRRDSEARTASGGLRYTLDRLSNVSLSFSWAEQTQSVDEETQRGINFEPETKAVALSYQRRLSPLDSVGFRISRRESVFRPNPDSFERQVLAIQIGGGCPPGFEPISPGSILCVATEVVSLPDNESDANTVTATWSRIWSPRWNSDLALGWTRVDSRQRGQSFDPSYSLTGSLEISRRTRFSTLMLSYSKFTRPSTSAGADVDTDAALFSFKRSLTRRLVGELTARWIRTRSASDANSRLDTQNVGVDGTLDWHVGERFTTFMRIAYFTQSGAGNFATGTTEFEDYRAVVGFRYFHPIDLY
jgi:hypothetical protein